MKLTWRGNEYTFNQRAYYTEPEQENRNSNVKDIIIAFDTESCVTPDGRYEPQCFQLSGDMIIEQLEYIPHRAPALELFINAINNNFGVYIMDSVRKQKHAFIYGHNLQYDWLQLIKNYPALIQMCKTGLSLSTDYLIFDNGIFKAILKKGGLFVGNAPYFEIEIHFNKSRHYILSFRDTFSFFPAALSTLGAELKLEEYKKSRPDDIGKIDYRIMEDNAERKEFELYAKIDARVTRLVAERIRDLHLQSNMYKIRVSAPSFAISYLLHSLSEYLPDKTKLLNGSTDEQIMQLVLNAYAGGRTGGIFHGKVENLTVLDIHSSYPASMTTLPSFNGNMLYYQIPQEELSEMDTDELLEILNKYHAFLEVDGIEKDDKYPSLIQAINQKLFPVYGAFENVCTTGVEVYSGIRAGKLDITKVHKLTVLIDIDKDPVLPFKIFANHAYDRKKNSKKGSPEYTSAKLVLNSSYGKLIESRSDMPIDEVNNIILPFVEGMKIDFAKMYYTKYIEMFETDRRDFINYVKPLLQEVYEKFTPEQLQLATLENFSLTDKVFGRYVIPAAAALITATSRARLVTGMKLMNALYWDTDSIFLTDEYDMKKYNALLAESKNILPEFIQPLSIGDGLGELDSEIIGASGYLAGTKRYFLANDIYYNCIAKNCKQCESITPDNYNLCQKKMALHGMPSTDKTHAEELIQKLSSGKNAIYTGRERPLKSKEAKTADDIGRFTATEYTSLFELDNRLQWESAPDGWTGKLWDFNHFKDVEENGK